MKMCEKENNHSSLELTLWDYVKSLILSLEDAKLIQAQMRKQGCFPENLTYFRMLS